MTDLEIVKLCADAMGIEEGDTMEYITYDPLRDDAQAFALGVRFKVEMSTDTSGVFDNGKGWSARIPGENRIEINDNLRRAICLCVAHMQSAKGKS